MGVASKNYSVMVDSNDIAYVEKYNHAGLLGHIQNKIKRVLMPQLNQFKALPGQECIDVEALEIKVDEESNRIEIIDKKTGFFNWAIGFLR